jgi:RNA polymerase sigma-70 factor (ECF subfamily)
MTTNTASNKPDFAQLVDQFGREIFAYLFRQLAGAVETEDCLQETFLRAFRAYHRIKPDSNYRAWLYAIATNVARTHFRQRQRQGAHERPLENRDQAEGSEPAKIVESKLELARVRRAVQSLPEKQRTALILRKYQELSYAEIGEVIACSPDSARANVYQALRSLRSVLDVDGMEVGNG